MKFSLTEKLKVFSFKRGFQKAEGAGGSGWSSSLEVQSPGHDAKREAGSLIGKLCLATMAFLLRAAVSQLARTTSGAQPAAALRCLAAAPFAQRMGSVRGFADEAKDTKEEFLAKWNEVAPSTLDPPRYVRLHSRPPRCRPPDNRHLFSLSLSLSSHSFASEFLEKSADPPADGAPVPSKLTFSFYLPHEKPYR